MVARMVRDHEAASSNLATPTKKMQSALCGLHLFARIGGLARPHGAEPCAAWFGESVLPLPVAEEGRALFPQRSKNASKA